jgi:integrase
MARRGKHEGSIYRRRNETWAAQVSIGGKRITYSSRSRAECQQWVRRNLDQIDQGMTFEGRELTLGQYLREWILVKRNAVRAKTAFQYEKLIQLYLDPGLGAMRLQDLNLRVVNLFYQKLIVQGVGVSNIRYTHRVLHAALEHGVRAGDLGRNAAHGAILPKRPHKEMQILNEQEVGLFLVAASGSRYRSLYHLAIVTGMRVSELRGLTWADVDWLRGTITVKRQIQDVPGVGSVVGAPKTHSGTRAILLGETTLNELRGQKRRIEAEASGYPIWKDNDLLFPSTSGTPFAKTDLQRDFWKLLKVAGVRRIRFHDLRHTAASLMLNHGVPPIVVSKILGHANASITLTIYAHSALDMQTQAAGIMDEIVTPIAVSLAQLQPIAANSGRD